MRNIFLIISILLLVPPAFAVPTHLDPSRNMDCSSCHKGHGVSGTLLLSSSNDQICFNCHGPSGPGKDIYSVINKTYKHDILNTAQYHQSGETLPEQNPSDPRHVSCFDCHNVHKLDSTNTLKGVRGYDGRGTHYREANAEYQVCYMCHSDSFNLPSTSHNIADDFISTNTSFHPVETYGKNTNVPSLNSGYSTNSIIKCSDCHGNDDSLGPKGPHGSLYQGMLAFQYSTSPGPESQSSYELCYQCHNRTSILNDESFKAHKIHIVNNNISCAQCHDPHGSSMNPYLIEFDTNYVTNNSNGNLTFQDYPGNGYHRCLLTCHVNNQDYEHIIDTGTNQYCINYSTIQNCPPGW